MVKPLSAEAGAKGRALAAVLNRRRADESYLHLYDLVRKLRGEGLSLNSIAAELNARGERTPFKARPWYAEQVRRVLARAERLRREGTPPNGQPTKAS